MATDVLVLRSASYVRRGWRLTESQIWFLGMFAIYFGAACFLTLGANVIYGDAFSRVEIAQRILFSRDPHLAAVGFLWNPLPVVALLPVVSLKFLWPQLATLGLAAGIVSAVCMAGAIVQVWGMLSELSLGRRLVILLTGAFAFHPMILFFGANGMSEAMLLLFLLIAVRYLARWLRDSDLNALVTTGIALSLAYFTRYEALAAAMGVITLVAAVSLLRARKQGGRISMVLCDVAIVAAPVTLAFLVWALASWLIMGHPFEQFASIYQNRTKVLAGSVPWSRELVSLMFSQLVSLQPLLPVLLLLGAVARPRHHLSLVLASIACIGSTLAFMILAELTGSIPNGFRYLIGLVPLTVVLAGACISNRPTRRLSSYRVERTIAFACVLCVVVALPVSAKTLIDPTINPDSAAYLQSVISPNSSSDRAGRLNWATGRSVAADLDRLNLGRGTVLVDDYIGFPIVVASKNAKQFVITSDRDFQSILADPSATGVRYILVPQPGALADLDAVNRQYPGFFDNGAGFASLVREYVKQGINDSTWRLYHVN